MNRTQSTLRRTLPALALLLALPATAAAAPRRTSESLCLQAPTGGGSFNTFIFQDVTALAPGRVLPLHGMYFNGTHRALAASGSAVMQLDGIVRVGFFVHSGATSTSTFGANNFTLEGTTDASFAGTYYFDNDGDFLPNGTLEIEQVDCSTIVLP